MNEHFIWVEKYRPRKIDDCILPDSQKEYFKQMVAKGEIQNMLLCGTAGTGKTTVARALCEELQTDYMIINGSEESGDGYRYCGRGLIQVTGHDNYMWFADSIQVTPEEASEYMETFEGAAQSACWFWETNQLNQWADKGDILTLTKRINGGTIGLEDRIKHYEHALHVLGA